MVELQNNSVIHRILALCTLSQDRPSVRTSACHGLAFQCASQLRFIAGETTKAQFAVTVQAGS